MNLLKKFTFAPIFLISFAFFGSQLDLVLKIPNLVFSLSLDTLIALLTLTALALISSLFFILFSSFVQDWIYSLPLSLLGSVILIFFLPSNINIVLGGLSLLAFSLIFLPLRNQLITYLNFHPTTLLTPSIKQLASLLIIIASIGYFLSINQDIEKNGFKIPDSLIDNALKFVPQSQNNDLNSLQNNLPGVSSDQLNLLKQNPSLLKQAGIDPSLLNNLSTTQTSPSSLIKDTVNNQLQNIIAPYKQFIPFGLSLLLYFSLSFFLSIMELLLNPLIWLIFLILEKTNFIRFSIEMREVKKMMV
ncbi:hypothetical protein HY025_01005 [Candidatus Daviesbacteria bacterium]|nr:hypothetical protein [Candidatus Daviesbacteria bacterium]